MSVISTSSSVSDSSALFSSIRFHVLFDLFQEDVVFALIELIKARGGVVNDSACYEVQEGDVILVPTCEESLNPARSTDIAKGADPINAQYLGHYIVSSLWVYRSSYFGTLAMLEESWPDNQSRSEGPITPSREEPTTKRCRVYKTVKPGDERRIAFMREMISLYSWAGKSKKEFYRFCAEQAMERGNRYDKNIRGFYRAYVDFLEPSAIAHGYTRARMNMQQKDRASWTTTKMSAPRHGPLIKDLS
ncbi:hypothetical protein BCR39DRAFT_550593 [Naematelia encephala]|uniref:BRCT domain-containing protein n=1 Tax=Naematelia encephala TaxID=71784 RepID=A0A1Y2AJZ9_9TREE|nr:hypothetical protein BCR39DRAFT_550593 [Naematelia encephala]